MRKSGSVYYLHVWLHSGVGEIWLISPSEWLRIDRPEQLTDTHRREAAISGQDSFFFLKLARIHLTQSIWVNFITLTARQNTRSVRGVDPVHLLSISSRIIRSNNEEFLIRVQQRTITSSATTKGNALGKLRISDRLFGDEVPWHKKDREVKDTPVFRSAIFVGSVTTHGYIFFVWIKNWGVAQYFFMQG